MTESKSHAISPDQAITLHGLLVERVKLTPDAIAYRHFDNNHNAWISFTWLEVRDQVARWQAAVLKEHLDSGERVAVMMPNCPQWIFFDQAALSLGLVVVPLYTVDRADNIAYIINDAEVKVLLFENAEQWQALSTVRDQLGGVVRFVSIDELKDAGETRLKSMVE